MEPQILIDYFSTKLDLTQKSILFLKENSNLEETISTINSNVLLLNEIKEKIAELKEVVIQWKNQVAQVKTNDIMCFNHVYHDIITSSWILKVIF